jgi:hypothetical protein
MKQVAAGLYVPVHHAVSGSTDWTLIVGLIAVMAIALTVVLVYANRSVKTLPSRKSETRDSEPRESGRKAA